MDKPRILFTSGIFPPALGGPGTMLVNLLPRLAKQGYQCMVLTFCDDDHIDREYKVRRIPLWVRQPIRSIAVFLQVLSYSRSYDIIYTLDTYTHGLASLCAAAIRRKPLVIRFTGDSAWEKAYHAGKTTDDIVTFNKKWHGIRPAMQKWIRSKILRKAVRIITDCEFLKDLVGSYGIDTKKVRVINNAVQLLPDVSFDQQAYKQKHGLKKYVLLSLGRLVPWKGNRAIVEVMPDIMKQYPETSFAVVGDGPELEPLKQLARDLHIEKHVIFFGRENDKQEKSRLYDVSDIYVQNTFYEGMSNALLEAMGKRKAVMTTRAGGNTEFVSERNGALVTYNSKKEIIKAILMLLGNEQMRQQFGEASRQTALEYTWEALTEKNSNLITEVWEQYS